MLQRVRVAAVLALCVLMSASAPAAEKTKAPAKKAPPKAKTHTVEAEPLRIDITLKGVFEAKRMAKVSLGNLIDRPDEVREIDSDEEDDSPVMIAL